MLGVDDAHSLVRGGSDGPAAGRNFQGEGKRPFGGCNRSTASGTTVVLSATESKQILHSSDGSGLISVSKETIRRFTPLDDIAGMIANDVPMPANQCFAISPNRERIAVGMMDGTVEVISCNSQKSVVKTRVSDVAISQITVNNDASVVIVADELGNLHSCRFGYDGNPTCRPLSPNTSDSAQAPGEAKTDITEIGWLYLTEDASWLSIRDKAGVRICQLNDQLAVTHTLDIPLAYREGVKISPFGTHCVKRDQSGVTLWDFRPNSSSSTPTRVPNSELVGRCVLTKDLLVAQYNYSNARVWNLNDPLKAPIDLGGHTGNSHRIAV